MNKDEEVHFVKSFIIGSHSSATQTVILRTKIINFNEENVIHTFF